MKQRVITGTLLILLLVPIFIIERLFPYFYGLMIMLTAMAAFEMLLMFNEEEVMNPFMMIVTILATVLFYLALIFSSNQSKQFLEGYDLFIFNLDFNITLLVIGFTILVMIIFTPKNSMKSVSHAFTTIIYIGLGFASMTILRMLGIRFIVYLFLISILTDMNGYFFGIKFGKRRLAKEISPKKSLEGAIAGTIIATVVASMFALFYSVFKGSFNPDGYLTIFTQTSSIGTLPRITQAFIVVPLTLFASVVGQIGDLVASKFKRTYEIKDFGSIFPGHGGVLDRFDSSIFISIFLILVLTTVQALFPL